MKLRRVTKPVAWFTSFTSAKEFEDSRCMWCEPMLAQEISEAEQEKQFKGDDVYVEEKFDGREVSCSSLTMTKLVLIVFPKEVLQDAFPAA